MLLEALLRGFAVECRFLGPSCHPASRRSKETVAKPQVSLPSPTFSRLSGTPVRPTNLHSRPVLRAPIPRIMHLQGFLRTEPRGYPENAARAAESSSASLLREPSKNRSPYSVVTSTSNGTGMSGSKRPTSCSGAR